MATGAPKVPSASAPPPPGPDAEAGVAEPSVEARAAEDTRAVIKWTIATLGAIAVAVFGAGPIINKPNLDWSKNGERIQLLVALAAGAAGLAAIVVLIGIAARMLQPELITLADLPPGVLASIGEQPGFYLPSDAVSAVPAATPPPLGPAYVAAFRQRFVYWKRLEGGVRTSLRAATLKAARVRADPNHTPAQMRDANTQLATAADRLQAVRANRTVYESAAAALLDRARFEAVGSRFDDQRTVMLGLAVVAAVGGVAVQLALSMPTKPAPAP